MALSDIYSLLPENSFRILKIFNANEENSDCKLEIFTFDEAPAYTTLSYSWGPLDTSAAITCNGCALSVSQHLQAALHHLYSSNPDGWFWIDAICINQQDNDEKSRQTRSMDVIYRSAELVEVWLGKAKNGSDLAMDQIPALGKKLEIIRKEGTPENAIFIKGWLGNDELASSGLPETDDPIWTSLGYIYSQTWFTRLWVLQEVILAKKVIFAHGAKEAEWEPFVKLGNLFSPSLLLSVIAPTPGQETTLRTSLTALHLSQIAIERKFRNLEFFSIPPLLTIARSRQVTVPVDKIYGMLGMMHPQVACQIVVDYSEEARRDWWNAYIQYGKLQLRSEGMLSLLTMAPSIHRPRELPSWCPNFDSPPKDPTAIGTTNGYKAGFETLEKRISSRVLTVSDSNNLKFFGFRVDRIHTIAGSAEHCWQTDVMRGPSGIADRLLEYEKRCLALSQQTFNEPNTIPASHWRSLVADADLKGQSPLPPDVFEDYLLCKKVWASHRDQTPVNLIDTLISSERQRVLSFQTMIEGRKTLTFFSTHEGRVGLGPSDLEAGDVICVLYGGAPLFVLRYNDRAIDGSEGVAQLVGVAFVHGLMDLKTMPSEVRGRDEYFTIG